MRLRLMTYYVVAQHSAWAFISSIADINQLSKRSTQHRNYVTSKTRTTFQLTSPTNCTTLANYMSNMRLCMKTTIALFSSAKNLSFESTIKESTEIVSVINGLLLGGASLVWVKQLKKLAMCIERKERKLAKVIMRTFHSVGYICDVTIAEIIDEQTNKPYFVNRLYPCLSTPNRETDLLYPMLHELWYTTKNGKSVKIVPAEIDSLLVPIALAYWIACDGLYPKAEGVALIKVDRYTPEEVALLISTLERKYNLKATMSQHGEEKQRVIRFEKSSMSDLQCLVAPHIPLLYAHRVGLKQ